MAVYSHDEWLRLKPQYFLAGYVSLWCFLLYYYLNSENKTCLMNNYLPDILAFWTGSAPGEMERCCLRSFVLRGHRVYLYSYSQLKNLPDGVILQDAADIIAESDIFLAKKGCYALFSDIFRYHLLRQKKGIYVDCDVYCLAPVTIPEDGYLLGYEDDNKINGAVLALPQESPLLNRLLHICGDSNFVPPWYTKKQKKKLRLKRFFRRGYDISQMPWGVLGPLAISWYLQEYPQIAIQPLDVFYPVHYLCVSQFIDPELDMTDIVTSRTKCIHLYHEKLRHIDISHINENCILAKMLRNVF